MVLTYREVVCELIDEYKAAERPDYVTWGGGSGAGGRDGGSASDLTGSRDALDQDER